MKSIQNTLGAMAIFAGMFAGSTFAEETQTAKSNTQTATATAVGNAANNAGKTTPVSAAAPQILSVSALEFKKQGDVEKLVGEAKKFGLKFEAIDDEQKFKALREKVEISQMATKVNSEDAAELLSRADELGIPKKARADEFELAKEAIVDFLAELKEKYDISIPLEEEPTRKQLITAKIKIENVLIQAKWQNVKKADIKTLTDEATRLVPRFI